MDSYSSITTGEKGLYTVVYSKFTKALLARFLHTTVVVSQLHDTKLGGILAYHNSLMVRVNSEQKKLVNEASKEHRNLSANI